MDIVKERAALDSANENKTKQQQKNEINSIHTKSSTYIKMGDCISRKSISLIKSRKWHRFAVNAVKYIYSCLLRSKRCTNMWLDVLCDAVRPYSSVQFSQPASQSWLGNRCVCVWLVGWIGSFGWLTDWLLRGYVRECVLALFEPSLICKVDSLSIAFWVVYTLNMVIVQVLCNPRHHEQLSKYH